MDSPGGDNPVVTIVERWKDEAGALLPVLHEVQAALGYVPPESVADIAAALNLSRAEVHGVVSFYHDFRTEPGGNHRVQICRAEACQAVGARELEQHATAVLDVALGETTADGAVTLEGVYCLGNCACGPSVRIGDRIHARVDADKLDALLAACHAEATQ
jgi:formate dehydrogenase subunit gamma